MMGRILNLYYGMYGGLLALVMGCGPDAPPHPRHVEAPHPKLVFDMHRIQQEGSFLKREDGACTLDTAVPQLDSKVTISVYVDKNKPSSLEVDMQEFSGKGISSLCISGVYAGMKGVQVEKNKNAILDEGAKVPICRANGGYSIDSMENTALVMAYISHKTMQLNRQLEPRSHGQPLKVHLQPMLVRGEKLQEKGGGYLQKNNAYWSPGSLTFLPPSHNFFQISSEPYHYYNWLVIGHEIGHEVFQNLAVGKKTSYKKEEKCLAVDALSEGICDLFGHLHWQKEVQYSLMSSRDIRSFLDEHKKRKQLTLSAINILEGADERGDPHVIGSYIAFGFLRLLEQSGYKGHSQEQLEFLMGYLSLLNQQEWPEAGADFLALSVHAFAYLLMSVQKSAFTVAQCQTLGGVFPFLGLVSLDSMETFGCSGF